MTETKTTKDFSDTTDSFRPENQFNYHYKQGECNYKLFLQNQVKEILKIFQDGNPTQDTVQGLLRCFSKETDLIISQLLTETAQIRKKLRTQHDYFESVIREQKFKVRKLVEENIDLTSTLKVSEKSFSKTIESLKNEMKEESQSSRNEIKGLQSLLSEYQKELEQKDKSITDLHQQCATTVFFYEQAKMEILNQSRELSELRETCDILTKSLTNKQILIKTSENKQIDMILNQEDLFEQKIKQKDKELFILASSEVEKGKTIKALLLTVQELKEQLSEQKQERIKCQEREFFLKEKFKTSTDMAISSIKEKYKTKISKINELMKKELKKAKKQVENLKVSIPKEIYLCLKETKGALFSEMAFLQH